MLICGICEVAPSFLSHAEKWCGVACMQMSFSDYSLFKHIASQIPSPCRVYRRFLETRKHALRAEQPQNSPHAIKRVIGRDQPPETAMPVAYDRNGFPRYRVPVQAGLSPVFNRPTAAGLAGGRLESGGLEAVTDCAALLMMNQDTQIHNSLLLAAPFASISPSPLHMHKHPLTARRQQTPPTHCRLPC